MNITEASAPLPGLGRPKIAPLTFDSLFQSIVELPVFDTHTHLESGYRQCTQGLYARNFFDICRYFWFERELEAVGLPRRGKSEIEKKDFPQHAKAYHAALRKTRNTTWTRTVMEAMEHLYGIRPDSVGNILELSDTMERNLDDPDWGYTVCDRIGIRTAVIGPVSEQESRVGNSVHRIGERTLVVPAYRVSKAVAELGETDEPHLQLDALKERIRADVAQFHAAGIRTVRADWPFVHDREGAVRNDFSQEELRDPAKLTQHLGHFLFGVLQECGFALQVFFGMERPTGAPLSDLNLVRTYAQNDTTHVAAMHNIFEMYPGIRFELFCASELSSLDMVQAARIYPNVYPGGLWWFTFRRSVYERSMQYRVEALPASRATFVASDARCIEWSYIKILLIKKIMARFFHNQIREGWLDEDAALYTARNWLHDSAERIYFRD